MKALILIGGLGTRLRPLTCGTPKPLLPVVNVPLIRYQLEHLRRHGIREAILATSYRASMFRRALGDGRSVGLKLRYAVEKEPLGTGGGIRNAARWLDRTTLILNGDILQHYDIGAFLRRHRRARAEASILLVRVADPTSFGLVETGPDGRVRSFLEKPSADQITCDTVNAGAYLFEPGVAERIPPGRPCSVERELFPELLRERRRLYGFETDGYWMDVGTVAKYLQVHLDILDGTAPYRFRGVRRRGAFLLERGARPARGAAHEGRGRVLLGAGTRVGPGARFIGPVSVGAGCRIGAGASLRECVLLDGAVVGDGARLERCVIGRRARVGANAEVGEGSALGDRSAVTEFSKA